MPILLGPDEPPQPGMSDALKSALAYFLDFDRRVSNQLVVDRVAHVGHSAATSPALPRLTHSESNSEGGLQ